MAYRRKRGRRRSRSRRLGAVGRGGNFERLGGLVLGAAATGFLNKWLAAKLDPKLASAGAVVLGFVLPNFVKGPLFQGVGDGMIAAGGLNLLNETGILSGLPVISGWQDLRTINGMPDHLRDAAGQSETGSPSYFLNGLYGRRPFDGRRD